MYFLNNETKVEQILEQTKKKAKKNTNFFQN